MRIIPVDHVSGFRSPVPQTLRVYVTQSGDFRAKEGVMMPLPQVKVEQREDHYFIRVVDRPPDLDSKFKEVHRTVNLGLSVPRTDHRYKSLFNEGPLLENQQETLENGQVIVRLAGLKVFQRRLDATIKKLQQLGFEVIR